MTRDLRIALQKHSRRYHDLRLPNFRVRVNLDNAIAGVLLVVVSQSACSQSQVAEFAMDAARRSSCSRPVSRSRRPPTRGHTRRSRQATPLRKRRTSTLAMPSLSSGAWALV